MSCDQDGAVKPARNQAVETLRILAALGIVAFHSGAAFHDFAYSGLIIFLVLSPLMDTRYNWERRRSPKQLARIFLVPWAFWMVVYGAENVALHKPAMMAENPVSGILYGTSPHLWFLPFMCMALIALNATKGHGRPILLFWSCAIAATLLLVSVTIWRPMSFTWPPPLPQWIHALPAVLIGAVIGLRHRAGRFALPAMLMVACALGFAVRTLLLGISIPYGIGLVLVILAAAIPADRWPAGFHVQPVSECMMGVYLVHILFLQFFSKISGEGNYVTVLLAFFVASLAVWTARRTMPASKLVLG